MNAKGNQITVNGKDTFKITSDTKVIFVNSDAENGKDDYAGVAGNTVSTSNEADEIADTGMYFYNCAYILDGGYTKNGQMEQLATMLWRYDGSPAPSAGTVMDFPDLADLSDWAADAMTWAVDQKIVQGYNGTLIPREPAIRGQVAAMLWRYLGSPLWV